MALPMAKRVGFFGPFGTFTQQALLTQADLADAEHVAYRTVPDVLDAVERGEIDLGVVPIENSIEGMVNFTQDALAFDYDLLIQREIVIDIEHCLLARPGVALADVRDLYSIPVATAQCHHYLRDELPDVQILAAYSTADAAKLVSERDTSMPLRSARAWPLPCTASRCSRPTLPTTTATRHGSWSLPARACQRRPATTRPHS